MTIATSFRHFCRGLMLGIGLIPGVVYFREGTFYVPFQSQALLLAVVVITCGVVGCIWIPFIKRLTIYWLIERPLIKEIRQHQGSSQQLLGDLKQTLEHALSLIHI